MSVQDHGLEAIRKAASQVTSGSAAEYKLRTFSVSGMISETYDYVSLATPDSVTEVYTFKSGGSGGTTVATITIVYTSSTKETLSTVTRT